MPVVEGEHAGAHRPLPADLAAAAIEGQQPDLEPAVGAEAVRVEELLAAMKWTTAPAPGDGLAGARRSEEHQVPDHDRRRMPPALDPPLPADVFARAPAERRRRPGPGAGPGSAPPGPVGFRAGLGRAGGCRAAGERGNRNERREQQRPSGGTREETHRGAAVASAPGERKAWRWSTPRRNTAPPGDCGRRPDPFAQRAFGDDLELAPRPEDGQVPLDAADQDVSFVADGRGVVSGRVVTDGPGKGRRRSRGRAR